MTQTADAGGVLTAGQVGERLGLKAGMVRRYALALEEVTGISLEVDPLKGRLYPPGVVDLLEQTRAHLLAHPGQSVDAAMRAVTGQGEADPGPPARLPGVLHREELAEVMREALAPTLAPITAELEATRAEVTALRHLLTDLPQRVAADLLVSLPHDLAASITPELAQQLAARVESSTAASIRNTLTPDLMTSTAGSIAPDLAGRLALIFGPQFRHQLAADLAPGIKASMKASVPTSTTGPTSADLLAEIEALRGQVARLEVTAHAAASAEAYQQQRGGLLGILARLLGR